MQSVIQEVYKEDHKGISSIIYYGIKSRMFKETHIYKSAYGIMVLYVGISMLRVIGFKPEEVDDDVEVFWDSINRMINS